MVANILRVCLLVAAVAWAIPVPDGAGEPVDGLTPEATATTLAPNFVHAFIASFSVIVISEIGDKTFFIAAIMAMRHKRLTIFLGAISALGIMTVLSAYVGHVATYIPRVYTFYISTALFVFFGLKMLKEGYYMDPDEGQEELEEVTMELNKKEQELASPTTRLLSPVFVQAFVLTFLAEWGDRSQISTIILGAREDPLGVTLGGVIGHSICTAMAVIGGRMVAQRISVRTVHLVGGVVFLLFAIAGLLIEGSS